MRVLIVTSMYPSSRHPSYGIFVAEQVRSLCARGLDTTVLFFSPRETRFNYALILPRLVERLRSSYYDVLHTHHTYSLMLVDLARRLARVQVPVVLTNHEGEALDKEKRTRTWHPTSRLRHSGTLKQFAATRADFVIFVSRELSEALPTATPHEVIPCGVDLDRFRPLDQGICRDRLGLSRHSPVIFFPNNPRGRGKWFALAQAALDIVRQTHPEVILLAAGGIPYDLMPYYYNAADVVLQASFYEASPTVVKEALACEVPIVSTDSGDTHEVVRGVPHCFVCLPDAHDLARHILQCLGQRAVGGRDRLIAHGLDLPRVAERVAQVYRRVLNGEAPQA